MKTSGRSLPIIVILLSGILIQCGSSQEKGANGGAFDGKIKGDGYYTEAGTGRHHVSIWQAGYWTGNNSLSWKGDVKNILFTFDGSGGAIGRIGKWYDGVRVADIDESPVNVNAQVDNPAGGSYFFTIYGWVYDTTSWGPATRRDEYYVIEDWTSAESDPLIGSLTVDGVEYEMHKFTFAPPEQDMPGYRFKAIRKSGKRRTGPVNMKPFFEYWLANGMEDGYLGEMTWAIELLGGRHKGTFTCTDIEIPEY